MKQKKIHKYKIIKKIIIYLFIFFGFINNSYAEGSCESGCKIKNGTPEILLEYISNNRKIIQNISNNLGKAKFQGNFPTDVSIGGNSKSVFNLNHKDKIGYINKRNLLSSGIGLRIYNSLFNWKESESGVKYFLDNIESSVPSPISRDLRLIDNQDRALNYFLSKVIKNGYSFNDLDPEKVCEGIEDNGKCKKLLGNNIEEAIKNLIDNNNHINFLLRKELGFKGFKQLVGDDSYDELFLIPDNFKQEIKNNYNKQTYKSCAECKGGSIYRINKMKNKILLNDKKGKDGIQEWIDAWNLLLGINDPKNEKENLIERNLLKKELDKQGISSNNGSAVLNSLKNFQGNDYGFSPGNNPITNSFRNYIEEISKPFKSKPINDLTDSIANITDSNPNKKVFKLGEIKYTEKNLGNDSRIYNKVNETIKQNIGIVARQNKNTDKLQGRIIQLHINLAQTINTLEKIVPKAEKICNDQDTGEGICSVR